MPQRLQRPVPAAPVQPAEPADRRALREAARRRRRAELLERQRVSRRRRLVPVVVAAAVLVLLVGGPALLAFAPILTVRTVAVAGGSATTTAAVRAALEGELGRPLALVADRDVAAALAHVRVVETYDVVRRPPDTLEVRVTERTAVAQQLGPSGWERIDAAWVGLGSTPGRTPGLPVVTVPEGATAAFRSSVAAIAALRAAGMTPARVRATSADDVVVVLGGRRIRWGGAEDGPAKAEAVRAALVKVARGASDIDVSSPGVVRTR